MLKSAIEFCSLIIMPAFLRWLRSSRTFCVILDGILAILSWWIASLTSCGWVWLCSSRWSASWRKENLNWSILSSASAASALAFCLMAVLRRLCAVNKYSMKRSWLLFKDSALLEGDAASRALGRNTSCELFWDRSAAPIFSLGDWNVRGCSGVNFAALSLVFLLFVSAVGRF